MNLSVKQRKTKRHFTITRSLCLVLFFGMIFTGSVFGQEQPLHYYDKLLDVHMLKTGQVWAVGHVGKIIHSSNYGKDWEVLDAGTVQGLFSVFFITPEKGWIAGESGLILHTTDGGKTWTRQGEGVAGQPLLMVKFLNENKGWAVGATGTILMTDDGGQSWRKSAFERDVAFNDIYFFNENKGFAACEFDNIMMTEDGGETWTPLTEESFGDVGNFFGIDFIDETTGVVVGTTGNIKITQDGGVTWEAAENNEINKGTLLKVSFFNDKQGVAIGLDGAMVFTKDGGHTWNSPPVIDQFTWFSGISLLDDGRGVVVGIGNILTTDDFGKSWKSPLGDLM